MSSVPRPRLIIDFDGTLIANDTTSLISQAGLDYEIQQGRDPPPWQHFGDLYVKALESHRSARRFAREPTDLPWQAKKSNKLRETLLYQRSLAEVEEASARRVITSALTNISSDAITRAATDAVRKGQVRFRDGALQLLAQCRKRSFSTQILSLNWSSTYVRACLETAACLLGSQDATEAVRLLSIVANEIPPIAGTFERLHNSPFVSGLGIRTSGDKFQHVQGSLREAMHSPGQDLFIYIGDSIGDLEGLLAADVGVCIRDDPIRTGQNELKVALEDDAGLSVHRLGDHASWSDFTSTTLQTQKLYWAHTPGQVLRWLDSFAPRPY